MLITGFKRYLRWGWLGILCAWLIFPSPGANAQNAPRAWFATQQGQAQEDLNAVYFADSKRGWIGGDKGFLGYTGDGGRTWKRQTLSADEAVSDIYFTSKENGFVLASNKIFATQDGGATWAQSRQFGAAEFAGLTPDLYSVRFINKKRGWIVGSLSRKDVVLGSLLLTTHDGGATWTRQTVPGKNELLHLDFVSDKRGWIVGAGGTILHTEDGGETWQTQTSGTRSTLYHVDFRNDKTGWIVGQRGMALRTSDGGQHWTKVNLNVNTTLLSVALANEDEAWIVGRDGLILYTRDGGEAWTMQENRARKHLFALFVEKNNTWAVGGDGMVFQYER